MKSLKQTSRHDQSQHAVERPAFLRRLSFEHFEERLNLSGTALAGGEIMSPEGGFIEFSPGDFLTPPASDFVDSAAGSATSFDTHSNLSNLSPTSAPPPFVVLGDVFGRAVVPDADFLSTPPVHRRVQ